MSSGSKKRKRLPGEEGVRYAGQRRRSRAGLMATTALQAGAVLLLAFPVRAQPAPNARPQGGMVVGGQASIAQSTAQTTIAQTSQRAAIDWRSYDVGQAHTVTYQQPNASSITLNRVNSPNPSQIAGRIQANGQVAIVNQSGVVFMNGSQVDVQSLIVSSANVSNANFMAGRMVFDQPGRPDAKIINAGTITVKATGLAALVAPQVQNSGVINAKLGHVVLAGAEAHTVDLYGDGLMSVDVTRQVQKAADGKTVLVTNSGTIAADGGTIVLTAQAADGIVTNLVSNTGRLRANSVGDRPGTIVMSAVGGSISIEGSIEANGRAVNGTGGRVALAATDTVALGATARVSANGRAGGGTVAVGTSPERARNQGGGVPAGSARAVTVAAGARIAADGRGTGRGGSVALLATDRTSMAGTITARGGKSGGDGGQVEVSSGNTFALTGTIDVGAPAGKLGHILIDPRDITIGTTGANDAELVSGGGTINANLNSGTDYTISDATISGFTGNVTLQASRNLFVSAGVTINLTAGSAPQALTLQAGNDLSVSGAVGSLAAASIRASGTISLAASSAAVTGATATGTATIGGTVTSTGGLVRVASDGRAGVVNINAAVGGGQIQVSGGTVNLAAGLSASSTNQPIAVSADALTISAPLTASGGLVALAPFTPGTPITVEAVKHTTAGLSLTPGDLALLAPAGVVGQLSLGDVTPAPSAATATAGSIAINAPLSVNAANFGLYTTGAITQTAALAAGTLFGGSGGNTTLTTGNAVGTLGSFAAGGSFSLFDGPTVLSVTGPVFARGGDVSLQSTTGLAFSGNVYSSGTIRLQSGGTVTQSAGIVAAGGGDLFVTGLGGDFTPTGGAISQAGGTLAASGRVRLFSGGDASFSGGGTVAGHDIEVIAPQGVNSFAGALGPHIGMANILPDPALSVTLGVRPATLRLDGETIAIGRAIAADTVELHSTGNTSEAGGSITADTLTGTAGLGSAVSSTSPTALPSYGVPAIGSALLDNVTNAVRTLGSYTATSGFTLDNGATMLTANAGVAVSTGALALRATNLVLNGGASLTAPRIELAADTIVNSPGQLRIPTTGSLALSPYSLGAYTIGAAVAGETAISVAQIQSLLPRSIGSGGNSVATLQLGSTAPAPASAAATTSPTLTTTDTLTINDALNLTGFADSLALNGRIAVVERPSSAITVATLSGGSGGTFQVDASSSPAGPFYGRSFNNVISQLGSITAVGDMSIASSASLATLSGGTITAGAGTVTLTTSGALAIGGTLGAGSGTGNVTLNAVTGIAQSTGTIQTITLSGFVGDANPAVTTGRDAVLTTPTNHIATLGNFTAVQGDFTLIDNQDLTVAAGATVTARNVTLTTNGTAFAMTVNGAIGACATSASANGVVSLTSTGNLIIAGAGAIVGGERATNLAGSTNLVANNAFVEAGRSGTPAYDGTITVNKGLVLQGGTVAAATVTSLDGVNQSGGVLSATTLSPGAYTFTSGDVYSGTALTLTAGLAMGGLITAPSITINAAADYTALATISSPGNIQINLGGSFTQIAGSIYAGGNLTISGPGNTPAHGLIAQSLGVLASGNTTELYAGAAGAVTIAGALSGQVVQVIEPAATMTFAPSTLAAAPPPPVTFPGYAVQFHCPGCETPATTPSAVSTPSVLSLTGTTPLLRIDAGMLTLTAPVTAATVELHSVGDTTQTAGAPITTGAAGMLTGTAGYAATIPLSGLPTWDSPVTLGSAVLTNVLNGVPVAGPYYTGGGLALASAVPNFRVKDYLVAGGGQSIALTNTQANGLLTIDGVNSGLLTFGSVRGGNFATNPHPNVRGIGVVAQSTVNPVVSPSRVVLTADQLSITAFGANVPVVDARGGIVSIAPFSANRAVSVDGSRIVGGSGLSLGAADLGHVNTLGTAGDVGLLGPRTLRLGSTDGTLTNAAASITLNTDLALNNQAAALGLYAKGDITESPATSATPGGLSIGRTGIAGMITGAAGGAVTLGSTTDAAPANHFDVLGPFAAGNGLSVSDTPDANAGRGGMVVQGTVSSGTGALGLLDLGQVLGGGRIGGTIAIGTSTAPATLDATGQSLTLVVQNGPGAAPAMTEAANSTMLAGILTGGASTNDPVLPTSLAYDVRLDASATNRIDTLNQFIVGTGPATAVSAQGAFRLSDAASLVINGPVVAKSVSIGANGMTIFGPIGTCIVGGSGGDVVLKSGLITIRSGTVGAQASLLLDANVLHIGGLVDAPTVGVTGSLNEDGGTLFGGTVNVAGGATLNSGVLHASSLNAAVTYLGGELYADNALTVRLASSSFSGSIGSSSGLTVNAGDLVSTGTLFSGGSLTLNAGDFSQTAGVIGAHSNVSIFASRAAAQTGGTMEAGGTLLVRAFGSGASTVSLAGTLAAQTVQLIEPGYALNVVPVRLGGAYAVNVGPLANVYHCPGCDTATPSSTAAILLPSNPALRPLNLRLDGQTLALGTLAADNVELHSVHATTQTGPLTALTLTGTAGYVGSVDQVPVYSPGTAQIRVAGVPPSDPGVLPFPDASVSLVNPANNLFAVTGYQAAGGLNLVDQPANQTNAAGITGAATGLTLTGIVRAGLATDPLDATAEATRGTDIGITTSGSAGALSVDGVLAGRTLTFTSGPITETGTLVAATLTGSAPIASFSTPNQVANLAQFDAPGGFGLLNARNLLVTGKVSAAGGNAGITAQAGAGTVSVPEGQSAGTLTIGLPPSGVDATVTARNVTLRGVDVIANGLVGACSVGDATTGNLTIAATGGTITVNSGAILGGQTSATLTATRGVQFQGGTLNSPTLAVDALALTSGLVFGNTVTLNRPASITGGTLNAGTMITPNGLTFTGGALYAGNALSLNAGQTLDGQISSGGTLTINGDAVAATANLTAANLAINTGGDFQQLSGLIAATGSVTVTAGGRITQAAPGQIEAGDTILLRASGGGSAAVGGQLAAARIEVVEPGAALSFDPAPLFASDNHVLRGAATVTLGGLANSFACPGCFPAVLPVSSVAPASATPGANRPAFLRVDGETVALGAAGGSTILAADGVELHSLGATYQSGSSLETLSLGGTAGYAGSSATLPVYALPGAQTRTASGYTLAPAVANGTVTLGSTGNSIASIGTYQVRGDDPTRSGLTLVTTSGLVVSGTVRAGPSSDPLDASAEAATGNAIVLTVKGGQSLQIGSTGLLAGSTVTLSSDGGIGEPGGGRIVAGSLTGAAGGDVTLGTATSGAPGQGGNQVGTLSAFATTGAFTLQDSRNLAVTGPVTAQNGLSILAQSGVGTASAAEGQAAGNLTLVGSVTSGTDAGLTAYGDLTGSSVTAPGTLALNAGGTVRVSGITAGSVTGTAGQSFDASGSFGTATSTSAVGGSLTLSDAAPLLLGGRSRSQTGALITAPSVTAAGELDSAQSSQFHVTNGDFTQTGGTVAAAGNLVIGGASDTVPVAGRILQQAGLLAAGGTLRLLAVGDAMQGGGVIAAPVVQVVSIFGLNTFGASQSASVTVPGAGVTLAGVLPGFTLPAATTTLAGRPATVRLDGSTVSLTRLTAADTVELHAGTNLGELSGGSITADTVLGSAGYAPLSVDAQGLPAYSVPNGDQGGAVLLGNSNNILRLGPFDARSGFTLADAPAAGLTVTGTVRAGLPTSPQGASTVGAPLSISVTGAAGTLTLGDNVTLAGSQITLNTSGAIVQSPSALLLADTLSGGAASAALTPTNGNQVAHLGGFTTAGNLAFLNAGDLQATGAVKAGPSLSLTSRGNLDVGGGSLAASTVALSATGTITESNGGITTGSLTASAAQITARAPANQIATTGALSAGGGIALFDAASLTTTGPITANNGPVLLQSQGDLATQSLISAPSITLISGGTTTLANTIRAGADLSVTAGARLAFQSGSQTTATTITTQSGSATTLSGTMNATSTVSLRSSQSLTLAGAISSPLLTARARAITLQGGTIIAGGTVQPSTVTAARLPDAPNRSGAASATSGAFFQADTSFVQANTVVSTTAGYPNSTIRISLLSPSSAATVSLASLNAPSTNLILDLQNGSGTGQNIRVANFIVSYAGTGLSPGIGSLNLTGVTVGSQVGTGAASAGVALANPSRTYQINACAVGSVNCVVLRPQAVPVGNPLKELSLSFFNDQDDDRDLLVPNITDQGL